MRSRATILSQFHLLPQDPTSCQHRRLATGPERAPDNKGVDRECGRLLP